MDALTVHRLHFAFTVTFHYIFPQLTMGLALLIVILKTMALRTGDDHYNRAARFWAKIFAVNFAMGVVTGIPMEFQFGTNWSRFSKAAGGVIGQTLAMEGVFSFFLESRFLGLFLFGEKRLGPKGHWFAAFMVCITLAMPGAEQYREGVRTWLAPVRALARPVSEGLFAGALDYSKLGLMDGFKMRALSAATRTPEGDYRDWAAILAWARDLTVTLRPVRPHACPGALRDAGRRLPAHRGALRPS
jgi:hypothetical protein